LRSVEVEGVAVLVVGRYEHVADALRCGTITKLADQPTPDALPLILPTHREVVDEKSRKGNDLRDDY
jgi:hypothetical protein